jgi:hypothetical protein
LAYHRFADIWTAVEDVVNLPVFVTVLSENVPQELHLRMQAVFIAKSNSSVHQRAKYGLFVGWVVMGPSVEVENGMCGFAVHYDAQRAVGSPVKIYVQEGKVALPFGLHGELNALMDDV